MDASDRPSPTCDLTASVRIASGHTCIAMLRHEGIKRGHGLASHFKIYSKTAVGFVGLTTRPAQKLGRRGSDDVVMGQSPGTSHGHLPTGPRISRLI